MTINLLIQHPKQTQKPRDDHKIHEWKNCQSVSHHVVIRTNRQFSENNNIKNYSCVCNDTVLSAQINCCEKIKNLRKKVEKSLTEQTTDEAFSTNKLREQQRSETADSNTINSKLAGFLKNWILRYYFDSLSDYSWLKFFINLIFAVNERQKPKNNMSTLYDSSNLTATKILEKHAVFNHSLLNRSLREKKLDSKAYLQKFKKDQKRSKNVSVRSKSTEKFEAFEFGYDSYHRYKQKSNNDVELQEIDLDFKKLNETLTSLYSTRNLPNLDPKFENLNFSKLSDLLPDQEYGTLDPPNNAVHQTPGSAIEVDSILFPECKKSILTSTPYATPRKTKNARKNLKITKSKKKEKAKREIGQCNLSFSITDESNQLTSDQTLIKDRKSLELDLKIIENSLDLFTILDTSSAKISACPSPIHLTQNSDQSLENSFKLFEINENSSQHSIRNRTNLEDKINNSKTINKKDIQSTSQNRICEEYDSALISPISKQLSFTQNNNNNNGNNKEISLLSFKNKRSSSQLSQISVESGSLTGSLANNKTKEQLSCNTSKFYTSDLNNSNFSRNKFGQNILRKNRRNKIKKIKEHHNKNNSNSIYNLFDSSETTTADNLLHLQIQTEKQEDSADNIKADKSSGASFLVDNLLFAPTGTGDSGISDKSSLPDSLITYLNTSGVKSKEYQNVPKTEICHSSQALDGLETQEDILPSEKTTTNKNNNANDIEDHIEIVNINYLSEKSDFYLQRINSFDRLNLNSTPKYRKKSSELIIDRKSNINNNNNSSALLSKKNLQLLDQNNRHQLYSIDFYDRNRDQRHSLDDDFSEILAKYKRKNINNNLKRSRTAECTTKSDDNNLTTVDVTTIIESASRTPTPILEISGTEQNKKSDLVDNQWIYINKNLELPLRFGRGATKKLKRQDTKNLEERQSQSSSSESSSCLPCAYLMQKMASLKKVHRKLSKKGSYNLSKNNSNATSRNTSISNVISTISVEPSSYEIEKANKKRSIIVRVQPESGVPGVTAPITDGKNVRNGEMNLNMNPKISCPEDEKENFCQMVKRFLFG